ncbi:hypothetical protein BGZ70_007464 [Mortierella alpina]|uniref:F-box domain-containing protein n=1 Tax=Mortierella alpina TaxID=64518 RepID=A0A9P6J920_MORAP|nr:hypothetical protein BGZ70_007464 [Mortierella alpina]
MDRMNPLDLPEIITNVGRFLPLWKHSDNLGFYDFSPAMLLSCTLVNKTWHDALVPVIWYVYNGFVMRSIPKGVIVKNSRHFRIFFYDRSFAGPFESRHLKSLVISWWDKELLPLVEANAGSLVSLVWKGSHLRNLGLAAVDWTQSIPEDLPSSDVPPPSSPFSSQPTYPYSPRTPFVHAGDHRHQTHAIKGLRDLRLDVSMSKEDAFVDLLRSCPDLENFSLYSENAEDARALLPILRDYCPKLSGIEYVARFCSVLGGRDYLLDTEYANLVLSARSLKSLKMDIPWLDDSLTRALLLQSQSLQSLSLRFHERRTTHPMKDAENVCCILQHCTELRHLALHFSPHSLGKEGTLKLFERPWACRHLRTLALTDVTMMVDQAAQTLPNSPQGPALQPYSWRLASAAGSTPSPGNESSVSTGSGGVEQGAVYGPSPKQKLFEQVRRLPRLATMNLNHVSYISASLDTSPSDSSGGSDHH